MTVGVLGDSELARLRYDLEHAPPKMKREVVEVWQVDRLLVTLTARDAEMDKLREMAEARRKTRYEMEAERDEALAEVERLREERALFERAGHPLRADQGRLDVMWQDLVRERDALRTRVAKLEAALRRIDVDIVGLHRFNADGLCSLCNNGHNGSSQPFCEGCVAHNALEDKP